MRYDTWAHILELEPSDLLGPPDNVVDEWFVVRRADGICVIGWQFPGNWEPCMSSLLVAFDVMTDTAADERGTTYRLLADAKGEMHPKIADYLERMSRPGALPR